MFMILVDIYHVRKWSFSKKNITTHHALVAPAYKHDKCNFVKNMLEHNFYVTKIGECRRNFPNIKSDNFSSSHANC